MSYNNLIEFHTPCGVTNEADTVNINFSNAYRAYVGNSIIMQSQIEKDAYRKFLKLKDRWLKETVFVSSSVEKVSNSAYKEIISFGNVALPWIIRDLKKTNSHWFYALEKISGKNPIKEENIGYVIKMKEDWINWANDNNIE